MDKNLFSKNELLELEALKISSVVTHMHGTMSKKLYVWCYRM